jgi:transposase
MYPATFMTRLAGFRIAAVAASPLQITLTIAATRNTAPCPQCGQRSAYRHSRYVRTAADLPWSGVPVSLLCWLQYFGVRRSACARCWKSLRRPIRVATGQRHPLTIPES